MRFARWVFWIAGGSGLLLTIPPFFLESQTGIDYPPPITHPEYYFGFFGVTVAWQLLFLVIGADPLRYRLAMLPALVEKGSFVIAIAILYGQGRAASVWLLFAAHDGVWFVLFLVAYFRCRRASANTVDRTQ